MHIYFVSLMSSHDLFESIYTISESDQFCFNEYDFHINNLMTNCAPLLLLSIHVCLVYIIEDISCKYKHS